MAGILEITDADFDNKVLKAKKDEIVIVDFWAPWCAPCRMLTPALEEVAKKFSGKVTLLKLNVDHNPKKSAEFEISGIPSVKMFKNGKVIDQFVGYIPEQAITEWVKKNVK